MIRRVCRPFFQVLQDQWHILLDVEMMMDENISDQHGRARVSEIEIHRMNRPTPGSDHFQFPPGSVVYAGMLLLAFFFSTAAEIEFISVKHRSGFIIADYDLAERFLLHIVP